VKNLMTHFAQIGSPREVLPSVRELLTGLRERQTPIGSISLGHTVVRTFLGEPLSEDDMRTPASEVVVDEVRRLAFTPGFLTGTSLSEVAAGIDRLVQVLLRLATRELHVIH